MNKKLCFFITGVSAKCARIFSRNWSNCKDESILVYLGTDFTNLNILNKLVGQK